MCPTPTPGEASSGAAVAHAWVNKSVFAGDLEDVFRGKRF